MRSLLTVWFAMIGLLAGACGAAGETRELPDEALELLDGGNYELRQSGTPRALNLWATWCTPCRAELPAFDTVASTVSGAEIIGINTGEAGDRAAELVRELGLGFTQVLDPRASVQTSMRITGMPATIFVDASGEVIDVHSGELDQAELEALLAEHFGATFDR